MSVELSSLVRLGTNKQVFLGNQLRTCLWGTSTTDTCTNDELTVEYADAYWASMQALTGSALTLKHNYGHYGYTTSQLYVLLPTEYSSDPDFDIAILQLASNDLPNAGVDYSLIQNFIEYFLFKGKKIILIVPYARVPNLFPERYIEYRDFCNHMKNMSNGLISVVDFYSAISLKSSPSDYLQPDGVHLNSKGAFEAGKAFVSVIQAISCAFDFHPYAIGTKPLLGGFNPVAGFTAPFGGSISSPYEYESGRNAVDFSVTKASGDSLFLTKNNVVGLELGKKYRIIAEIKAKNSCPVPGIYIRSSDSTIARRMRDEDTSYFTPKSYAVMASGDLIRYASIPFVATSAEVAGITAVIAFRNCLGKTFTAAIHYFDVVEAE